MNYRYFKFEKSNDLYNRKPQWDCYSIKNHTFLGVIQYVNKMKYSFIPNMYIMQDQTFLEDMAYFIQLLNKNKGII
jgi:hypothetical protein